MQTNKQGFRDDVAMLNGSLWQEWNTMTHQLGGYIKSYPHTKL